MAAIWGNLPRYGEFEIVGAVAQKPKLLGKGSFGKTFEAFRADNYPGGTVKESVALKVLDPALLQTESKRFQFIQEVTALSKFKHANLVHYIRGGEENGEVFYAMELCRGGDLRKLVERYGPLPERVVAFIGLQVASGLREVHQRHRLVHRDLKPENIVMLEEIDASIKRERLAFFFEEQESLCRIVDFGLVNFAVDTQDAPTRFVGSPMYASPEQIFQQPVDGRSDVYSLGMTMWFLAQGSGPLLGPDRKALDDLTQIIDTQTSPEEHAGMLPAHLSTEFRQILQRAVAKRPEARLTAAELHTALRQYLNAPPAEAVPTASRFAVKRVNAPLDQYYEIGSSLSTSSQGRSYLARRQGSSEDVRLTVVAVPMQAGAPGQAQAKAEELCGLAQLAEQTTLPGTFLAVKEIVLAHDYLAFAEEYVPHLTLTEVLRARGASRSYINLPEALAVLRPVAEALDFLVQYHRPSPNLETDEIWLEHGGDATSAETCAAQPLNEWRQLQVRMSYICQPPSAAENDEAIYQTMQASLPALATDLSPVSAFCCLLYRILTGATVVDAAHYTPHAYVPAVRLGPGSNNLLRDLLCKREPANAVLDVLKRLCAFEGVPWRADGGRGTLTHATARSGTHGTAGGTANRSHGALPTGTHGGTASHGSFGSNVELRRKTPESEAVCEVLSPGIVRSPFDPDGREQTIPAEQWKPSAVLPCTYTQRWFRLPKVLEKLRGRALGPGWVESPFAPGEKQAVPWSQWHPDEEMVCESSGKRFQLPSVLPYAEAVLARERTGAVRSPYDPGQLIDVPAASWEPGAQLVCPATGLSCTLPATLSPLPARAEVGQPGLLWSPYAPDVSVPIELPSWIAGLEMECPATHRLFLTPPEVEHWEIRATVSSAPKRMVIDPFAPRHSLRVPLDCWAPGATFNHPRHQRKITLPPDLPLLVGELVEQKGGIIRSPFSSEPVPVQAEEWIAGGTVTDPRTGHQFRLPEALPELLPEGKVIPGAPGQVQSPYDLNEPVLVPPAQWAPEEVVTCTKTQKPFRLPAGLPPLSGVIDPARPGWVRSPFSGEWQEVPHDAWQTGQTVTCVKTGRPIQMPRSLPEWLLPALWIPRKAGRVASPYPPHAEIDLTPEEWQPEAVLLDRATNKRFSLPPLEPFPRLELEKDAVAAALRWPEESEADAAQKLSQPGRVTTEEIIHSIWARHRLASPEERRAARATVFPENRATAPLPLATAPAPLAQAVPPAQSGASFRPSASRSETAAPALSVELPTAPPLPAAPAASPVGSPVFSPLALLRKVPSSKLPLVAGAAGLLVLLPLLLLAVRSCSGTSNKTSGSTAHPPPNSAPEVAFPVTGWPLPAPPASLAITNNYVSYPVRARAGSSPGSLLIAVPRELESLSTLSVQVKVPGWAPLACDLQNRGGSDYSVQQKDTWQRKTAPLELTMPASTDYDKVVATWVRSLPNEPETTGPGTGAVEFPINGSAANRQLPTGVYAIQLAGYDASRIKSFTLATEAVVSADGAPHPLRVPPSLAGEYWGLWNVEAAPRNTATFLILRVQPKAKAITVEELQMPRGDLSKPVEFRPINERPSLGGINQALDLSLETPASLSFRCPIMDVEFNTTLQVENSEAKLVVKLAAELSPSEIQEMRERVFRRFSDQVNQTLRDQRYGSNFRPQDLQTLQSGRRESLGRYARIADAAAYERTWHETISTMQQRQQARGSEIKLYPLGLPLYPSALNEPNFDAVPTPPH